ncbi:MAG: hypothetical protein HY800_07235, partial [Ignavibacteriales bacterium]|nr:hypothetical protein [Ignavibacteriales bacterium]
MRTILFKIFGWLMIVLMILIITAESYTPTRSVGFIERQDIKSHQQG